MRPQADLKGAEESGVSEEALQGWRVGSQLHPCFSASLCILSDLRGLDPFVSNSPLFLPLSGN